MTEMPPTQPPGWYYAQGDPAGTQRYWDGAAWQGGPQAVPAAESAGGLAGTASNIAGSGARIVARLIDIVLAIIVSLICAAVIGGGQATTFSTEYSFRAAIAGLIGGLLYIAYELYMTSNGGQTVGKKVMSTKIVPEAGGEVDITIAATRFSPYIASVVAGILPIIGPLVGFVVFLVGLASFVMIFTDSRNQAVWDKLAKTLVVKA